MASKEIAQKIVDLLLNDPGVCHLWGRNGNWEVSARQETMCEGCGELFIPKARGRQYCERACFLEAMERKKVGGGK